MFLLRREAEFDAREGPVHDALVEAQRACSPSWRGTPSGPRAAGELSADTDPAQLAFEVVALMETAKAMSLLHGEATPYVRARRGIASRLRTRRLKHSDTSRTGN
ncbi:TetR family transcriptional regulator C-terminal domain-containing protein [Streptomyces canus]|uniref:TetR family transcriptional regulator C-terminal domain-containing protein n=1 Tax=Streptomyces canus TaxID=58343 RepID=UPI0037F38DA3